MKYDYNKRKEFLKNVFEDTMEQIHNDQDLQNEVFDGIKTQEFYGHNDLIKINSPAFYKRTKTIVTKSTTMDAARKHYENSKWVAVLNFASATTPMAVSALKTSST